MRLVLGVYRQMNDRWWQDVVNVLLYKFAIVADVHASDSWYQSLFSARFLIEVEPGTFWEALDSCLCVHQIIGANPFKVAR